MTDLNVDGMAIAPGVLDTIISIAVSEVEGVAELVSVPSTGGLRERLLTKPARNQGLIIENDEDGNAVKVTVHIAVRYGYPLPDLAEKIREAVSDAVQIQVGVPVASLDVYVDEVRFDD